MEYLEILRIFLSMKKKKIIINQKQQAIFGVILLLNMKVKAKKQSTVSWRIS